MLREHTHEWFGLHVKDIDRARVWRILDRIETEVSIGRRKKLRSAIDRLYDWGILSGRITEVKDIPTAGYKSLRRSEEKLPEILTLAEIKIFMKQAMLEDHEWYPAWALALFTGLRSGELYALKWAKVDFENKILYVHENWTNKTGTGATKGRYWRTVPLAPQLSEFLKTLKLKTGNTEFVLPRLEGWERGRNAKILRVFLKGIGLPSVKFHTLRACFATQMIRDGVAPGIIMKIGGWKDTKTMDIYVRLSGIDVKGATDGLKLLPENEVMGRVFELFKSDN